MQAIGAVPSDDRGSAQAVMGKAAPRRRRLPSPLLRPSPLMPSGAYTNEAIPLLRRRLRSLRAAKEIKDGLPVPNQGEKGEHQHESADPALALALGWVEGNGRPCPGQQEVGDEAEKGHARIVDVVALPSPNCIGAYTDGLMTA
jgi:hypothetical protein